MSFHAIERSFFDLYWHLDPVSATQALICRAFTPRFAQRYLECTRRTNNLSGESYVLARPKRTEPAN